MTNIVLPYGKNQQIVYIPDQFVVDLIAPNTIKAPEDTNSVLLHAIDQSSLFSAEPMLTSTKTVAIAINDKTRPVPHSEILPPLLMRLFEHNIDPANITFVIAVGAHEPMTQDEYSKILPESIYKEYRVISHNCDDEQGLMYLGKTGRGTPVFVNKIFCESDIRMVVGNIEPHHFQGYSGGAKSASIGLAGRKTINHNHSMLAHSKSVLGEYSQNPCRQDVEEIGDLIGIHFAYNIVMNGDKKIVEAICGDPREVMEKGIPIAKMVYETSVATHYDLVIASVGGYPKDINLYQSQKALAHSARVVKDGGTIIIAAECREGIGSHSFEAFMEGVTSFAQVFEKLNSEGFRVGPHKALLIARDAMKANVILVSDMDPVNVKRFLLNSSPSVQTAVDQVVHSLSPSSRIAVLPKAASTIPALS